MADVFVLDASALLAALHDAEGAERVREILPAARIDSVNLTEVLAALQRRGVPEALIDEILDDLDLAVEPFTLALARRAGGIQADAATATLSLGACACLALAAEQDGVAVTADGSWADLDLDVPIEIVR